MTFAKYKPERRWHSVWVIEVAKALLKLLLLIRRRGRTIVVQGHPMRSTLNMLPGFATVDPKGEEAPEKSEKDAEAAPLRSIVAEIAYIR